ncbi:MAG: DNA-directed RNA polymerase subunit beta', partial [Dehalococcoidia bacterium]|nr:DNA-directed RNA polymerase subunit beta' [Dehalococcoidia bacterium]
VVGADITSGLPRVEELFEARVPKGLAVLSEIDGIVDVIETQDVRKIRVTSSESYLDEYALPSKTEVVVSDGQWVEAGTKLATLTVAPKKSRSKKPVVVEEHPVISRVAGNVVIEEGNLYIKYEEVEEREYIIPSGSHIRIRTGDRVKAGDQLIDGSIDPQDILRIMGRDAVQQYLVEEVQKVYRSQGVNINDKHIEMIIRQMLRRVRVESPGDTELLSGDLVDRFEYESINAKVLAEGGEPATAQTVLLGITRGSLNTSSWLAAASFQETTRVLTEAAIWGRTDKLLGLKENVIIGKLIPSQTLHKVEGLESETPELEEGESETLQVEESESTISELEEGESVGPQVEEAESETLQTDVSEELEDEQSSEIETEQESK